MKSLSRVGLGLSIVFGFLIIALIAQLYYLLYWKKKKKSITNTEMEDHLFTFCWTRSQTAANHLVHEPEYANLRLHPHKPFCGYEYGGDNDDDEMPTRFLYTIVEETNEDLESQTSTDTPYLTPLASPLFYTPPMTPLKRLKFNPLFESSSSVELNRVIRPPPPKFKFLQDAEDKFCRKMEESYKIFKSDEGDDGCFITINVDSIQDSRS